MVSGSLEQGRVPERSIGHAWKACVPLKGTEGSNPSPSAGETSTQSPVKIPFFRSFRILPDKGES